MSSAAGRNRRLAAVKDPAAADAPRPSAPASPPGMAAAGQDPREDGRGGGAAGMEPGGLGTALPGSPRRPQLVARAVTEDVELELWSGHAVADARLRARRLRAGCLRFGVTL